MRIPVLHGFFMSPGQNIGLTLIETNRFFVFTFLQEFCKLSRFASVILDTDFIVFFDLGHSATGSTSSLSALVRDRVRKKALDNISKKSAFEHLDTSGVFNSRRQEEFNRWYVFMFISFTQ